MIISIDELATKIRYLALLLWITCTLGVYLEG